MRTGTRSVEDLLARGGWALDDPAPRAEANPDTFLLPGASALQGVVRGQVVRAIFQVLDLADRCIDGLPPWRADGRPNLVVAHERMWSWVDHVHETDAGTTFDCILTNQPVATHSRLAPGVRLRIPARMVIEIDPALAAGSLDELIADGFGPDANGDIVAPIDDGFSPVLPSGQLDVCARAGVRPERSVPHLVRYVGNENLRPDAAPIYGHRSSPVADRMDSGWTFWADHAEMDDPRQGAFSVLTLHQLLERCPRLWDYLALPPGWAFVLGEDGYEDLYEEPSLLD